MSYNLHVGHSAALSVTVLSPHHQSEMSSVRLLDLPVDLLLRLAAGFLEESALFALLHSGGQPARILHRHRHALWKQRLLRMFDAAAAGLGAPSQLLLRDVRDAPVLYTRLSGTLELGCSGPDHSFGWHRCIATGLDSLACAPSVRIRRLGHSEAADAAAADEWWPLTSLRRLRRLRQGAEADAVVRAVGDPVEVERTASDTGSWQLGVIASVDWIGKSSFLDYEPEALSSEHIPALKVKVVFPTFAPFQGDPAAGQQAGGNGESLEGPWPWASEWVPMASTRLRHCDVITCVPRTLHSQLHALAALLKSS